MRFLEFHLLALISILSFIISLLETSDRIKDFRIAGRMRLRNLIDSSMFFSRLFLPIPDQLRIPAPLMISAVIGAPIFIAGISLIFLSPRRIYRFLLLGEEKTLVKDGVYGVVRHPLYLGDSIWPIGWSIIWMGLCSLVLTPLWLLFYIITTFYEERRLEEEFGDECREYRRRVKRIIPCLY
ncbi:MAG: methyltransferase family protein [Candidatus Methanodesulfokora sp.]|jgi:protein-S-isoprenylcysteine O-methyltransferase Ste14